STGRRSITSNTLQSTAAAFATSLRVTESPLPCVVQKKPGLRYFDAGVSTAASSGQVMGGELTVLWYI
ncbi:MAG: hypothetical protein WBL40_01925, partial [Terrimicrobiaceae bacterium]